MKLLQNEKIIRIMEKMLNQVDARLMDHGKRVAYLVYKVLEPQHIYTNEQLRDICILTMLHDIGAYKTEEIDRMVEFETDDIWEHSIYGYLFLKHFSPLKDLAPVLMCHHADCGALALLDNPSHQFLAQLISLCDRADVLMVNKGTADEFHRYIMKSRNKKYRDDVVDMFIKADINIEEIFEAADSDLPFHHLLNQTPLSREAVNGYIKLMVYAMDFRSRYTVIHTISTTCIATLLARLLDLGEDEIEKIRTGAMLHDVGKIGIPIGILDSSSKLSYDEMEIIKTHVDRTREILEGSVDREILNIAVRHHEKLDGSGYQKNYNGDYITLSERIVAVADIFSALSERRSYKDAYDKEKTCQILKEMGDENLIDRSLVSVVIRNYDTIMDTIKREAQPLRESYNQINTEYQFLMDKISAKKSMSMRA